MQRCPHCKIMNPETAERCDCGYDFASRTMKEPLLTRADAKDDGMDVDPALVSTRREHLGAEGAVKGAGNILLIVTAFGILGLVRGSEGVDFLYVGDLVVAGVSGALMRNLEAAGRWLYTLLGAAPRVVFTAMAFFTVSGDAPTSGRWLLLLGLLWPAVMLSILWSRKGRMVTSDHYSHVVAMTPQLKPGAPVWLYVVFVLSILLTIVAALAA